MLRETTTIHFIDSGDELLPCATGLVTLWFVLHYDQSRMFHWAMTLFWGLFALGSLVRCFMAKFIVALSH